MEGRICFKYMWGLKPVLVYACHTKPIFDVDYHIKRSNTPRNMSSRKRSNTYWSTNTFAPSVAICIDRIICHRLSAAICIGRPICLCSSAAKCIDRSICHRWRAVIICIGQPMSSGIGSNMHWLHQYGTKFNMYYKFNMIYNTCWNSYRLVQGVENM